MDLDVIHYVTVPAPPGGVVNKLLIVGPPFVYVCVVVVVCGLCDSTGEAYNKPSHQVR